MTTGSINSEVLFQQAIRGDSNHLGPLLQHYSSYLKLLASAQLDDRIRARISPSDVVQESLLEAHRDFGNFRGTSINEFVAWLRQILVNNLAHVTQRHVIAGKRDVRREVAIEGIRASLEQSAARLIHVLAEDIASPSAAAMHHEQLVSLADALAELPDDYRQVIMLRHIEALSFRDVASRMDRSEGAVRMLWLRAMDRLRLSMHKDEGE